MKHEQFQLHYNLRPATTSLESLSRDYYHGRLSTSEFKELSKSDANRPLDLEMLESVHNSIEGSLAELGSVLQIVNRVTLTPHLVDDLDAKERQIDAHMEKIRKPYPIWTEHLTLVFQCFEDSAAKADRGLVRIGEYEGTTAHWIACRVLKEVVLGWNSCKEVAERSKTDPRYLYSASAIELFDSSWVPRLPLPQALFERMRIEFTQTRLALEESAKADQMARP